MNKILVALLLLFPLLRFPCRSSGSAGAQVAKERPLMTKDLPDIPGKEGLIETVLLSPGEVVPAHRHGADVFAYVLKGSVITQVKGSKPETVHAGGVFYESPTDVHIASRNASQTEPAELLVFFVKRIGAPATTALPIGGAAH
jgi:quercetin dioxygenase-like cupin family protein